MIKKTITVRLSNGLEARPVAMLVQVASQYDSRIQIECGERRVNAKSIMGIMGLGLDVDKVITIEAEGVDAAEAILALEDFLSK